MKTNRFLSGLLALGMTFSLMPSMTLAAGEVKIDETNFKDSAFRTLVGSFDEDGNGVLSQSEIDKVIQIDASDKGIKDLSGIEFFTKLQVLCCQKNSISKLDLSKNTELNTLYAYENNLTYLDLTANTHITAPAVPSEPTEVPITSDAPTEPPATAAPEVSSAPTEEPATAAPEVSSAPTEEPPITSDAPTELPATAAPAVSGAPANYSLAALAEVPEGVKIYGQKSSANYVSENGKYVLDMTQLVIKPSNVTVTSPADAVYDSASGKVTFASKPTELKYDYDTGKGTMDVTVSLNRGLKVTEAPWASDIRRGSTLSQSQITHGVVVGDDGTELAGAFTWKDGSEVMSEKGTFRRTVIFTPVSSEYEPFEIKDVEVRVYVPGGSNLAAACTVYFETNGGSRIASRNVAKNRTMSVPENPRKTGYEFDGWYTDKSLTEKFDFSSKVVKSMTLYAKWTQSDDSDNRIILTIGKNEVKLFGKTVTVDAAPIISNDRTMLPIRLIAENLGASVAWDGGKKQVTIKGKNEKNQSITIVITIGSDTALVNGKKVDLDSPAFISNDRTYLPLRFVSENLGSDVDWQEEGQQIIITKK